MSRVDYKTLKQRMMLIFGVKGSSIMEQSINGAMMKVMNGEARYIVLMVASILI